MHQATAKNDVPPRGVYEELYRIDGCEVLVAVDSKGNQRRRVKVLPGVSYERAKRWLEQLLDRVDPLPPAVPMLELVRDRRASVNPRSPARRVHPAHADDYRAYRNRLTTQLSQRLHLFRD